jgi:hypothetical protein
VDEVAPKSSQRTHADSLYEWGKTGQVKRAGCRGAEMLRKLGTQAESGLFLSRQADCSHVRRCSVARFVEQ